MQVTRVFTPKSDTDLKRVGACEAYVGSKGAAHGKAAIWFCGFVRAAMCPSGMAARAGAPVPRERPSGRPSAHQWRGGLVCRSPARSGDAGPKCRGSTSRGGQGWQVPTYLAMVHFLAREIRRHHPHHHTWFPHITSTFSLLLLLTTGLQWWHHSAPEERPPRRRESHGRGARVCRLCGRRGHRGG